MTNLTPIILTDANAHYLTGLDKFYTQNIPDRSAPHRHKHTRNKAAQHTLAVKKGSHLEQLTHLNGYCILNDRSHGENTEFTFQGYQPDHSDPMNSFRKTTVDYIIVPSQCFDQIIAFDIIPQSYLEFNTVHNMLHMIAQDSIPTPNRKNPDGLDDEAILFPKYALTDRDMQDAYKAHLSNLLKPWVKQNFVRLVASHASAGMPHQITADETHRQILAIIREAAQATLGTRSRSATEPTSNNSV